MRGLIQRWKGTRGGGIKERTPDCIQKTQVLGKTSGIQKSIFFKKKFEFRLFKTSDSLVGGFGKLSLDAV